jgi:hypothetical protein
MIKAKSNWKAPYVNSKTKGPTNFKGMIGMPGVYLIAKNGKVLYIGCSKSDAYKACFRHFQTWNDPRQDRVVYKNVSEIKVKMILTSPAKAYKLEKYLIKKLKPRDNTNSYELEFEAKPKSKLEKEFEEYEKQLNKIPTINMNQDLDF